MSLDEYCSNTEMLFCGNVKMWQCRTCECSTLQTRMSVDEKCTAIWLGVCDMAGGSMGTVQHAE